MSRSVLSALTLSAILAAPALAAPPADPHAGHQHQHSKPAEPAPPQPSGAASYFGDVVLIDQDGRQHRLYSDLIKGKTVVIDVMFTSCTGVCPVLSRTFAQIQEHVGDRLGKDVYLLSFSVDPTNDTPAKLKEYAGRFGARPGWYFLTGPKENVDAALKKLGQYVETREAHQNIFIIGNDRTGLWKKAFGLADAKDILPVVDSVMNDKGEPAS